MNRAERKGVSRRRVIVAVLIALLVAVGSSAPTAQPAAPARPPDVESVLAALASPRERSSALVEVNLSPVLQRNPRVRAALIEELQRASALALDQPAGEFLLRLIEIVSKLRDPQAIPALVNSLGATGMACRAIAGFGILAAPALLSQWDEASAQGRLDCLALVVERGLLSASQRNEVLIRARSALQAPPDLLALGGAIDLALALGDPELIQEVEAIAADANAALRGGVQTRQHAAFLQRHAERALGRAVSVEATLDALRDGTLPERLNLLSDIETTRVLRTDQSIRRLLVQELNRVNAARFESGALDRGVEQYRRRLATALARLREPTAIPALARSADVSPGVASALAEFGNLAVPDMLAVWDTRGDLPFLELEPLWLGLLRAFSAIAVDGSTSDDMRAALAPVVRNALEEPVNAGTLMAAVDLALLIEMPQFRTEVTALASGAEAILDRGIAEPDALRVEEYAVRQLAVLPGSGEANSMGFFVTSTGLGDGGNLGGLDGADAHCQALAAAVGAGDRTWRAYLSTQGRGAVNARDRIGEGPWANAAGLVVATSVEGLHFDNSNFNSTHSLDENGNQVASRIAGDADFTEHDVLTGSQLDGTAFPTGEDRTCGNWTSNDEGSAMLGHADRYSFTTPGAPWNTAHPSRGCSQEDLVATGGAGLFYCFAID